MDLFSVLKTLHVLSATAWVGGGLLGTALGMMAARKPERRATAGHDRAAQMVCPAPLRARLLGDPQEMIKAIAVLASDDSSAITGASLPVDCGLTAGNLVMARELLVEEL